MSTAESLPVFGLLSTQNRARKRSYAVFMAKRGSISPLEAVLRDNVLRLVKKHYEGKPGRLSRKNKNVVVSKIQRIIEDGGCTIHSLGPVADAFGLKPYQLLIHGLDVDDPQVYVTARTVRAINEVRQGGADEVDGKGT